MQTQIRALLALAAPLAVVAGAQAQVFFTLTPTEQTYQPGQTVSFSALLQNATASSLTLLGASVDTGDFRIEADATPYVDNFEGIGSLTAGGSRSGEIVQLTALPSTQTGAYNGSITLQYTLDGGVTINEATASFLSTIVIPEPASLGLALVALPGAVLASRRRRKK